MQPERPKKKQKPADRTERGAAKAERDPAARPKKRPEGAKAKGAKAPAAAASDAPSSSRRTVTIVAAAGVLGVGLLVAGQAPGSIQAAGKRGYDCLNAFYRTGEGSTAACVESAEGSLGWARLVPGQAAAADDAAARVRHYAAELDLLEASARKPDAAQRKAAAERGMAERDAAPDPDALTGGPVFDLAHSGAFEEAVRFGDKATATLQDRSSALGAAAAIGDLEALRRFAAKESPETSVSSMDYDARRGAWLCLLGDAKAGVRALGAADATWRKTIPGADADAGWWKFRVGIVACGGTKADLDFDPTSTGELGALQMVPIRAADPALAPAAKNDLLRPVLERWSSPSSAKERLPLVAMQMAAAQSHEELVASFWPDLAGARREVLYLVSGSELYTAAYPSPWLLFPTAASDDALGLHPAGDYERSAERLEALAADAPEKLETRKDADEGEAAVRAEPKKKLAAYAAMLRLAAGIEWTKRGQPERARANKPRAPCGPGPRPPRALVAPPRGPRPRPRAALAKADGLDGSAGLLAAARLAAGDAAGALALLPTSAPSDEDDARAYRIQKTLALSSLGKFDEAYAEIKAAGDVDHAAVAWLLGAMALQVGDKDPELFDLSGELDERHPSEAPLASFLWWWRAIHKPEAERRVMRGRSGVTMWQLDYPREVLPAVLRVVGAMAEGSGDVDVWLDYVFSGPELQGDRVLLLARAEAARWRGDKAAAARWDERAKKLLSVIKDDRAAVLAAVAGL